MKTPPNSVKAPSAKTLRRAARERFLKARKAEAGYQRHLTSVSKQIGSFIEGHAPKGRVLDFESLRATLMRYAELIKPWARAVTERMHSDVARRDLSSWVELGRTMGRELRKTIQSAPVGTVMRKAMNEQVDLITSLPTEAAQRVHKLTMQALLDSTRADEIAKEIMKSGQVTASRARTIARTEVARTGSLLTESRAKYIGSTHYIWHTAGDSDVRPSHRKLNNRTFAWDAPPVSEPTGERSHPGQIWNCRCYAEPVIPDKIR